MSKRKICVVITARPSYSRVKTALEAIKVHPNLELQLVVTGSALLSKYGSAVDFIEKDNFKVDEKAFVVVDGETITSMAKSTGLALMELANIFYNIKPDMVITIADRYETIATSIAAAYQNIPLVHIQGGEITGNIDEKVRHANTKFADIHLVSTEKAKERVIKLGESKKTVFNTGCPSIDLAKSVLQTPEIGFDPIKKYGGVGADFELPEKYLVVLQHPVTTEYGQSREHVHETLDAINELNIPTYWFWPNIDAGSSGTANEIRNFREKIGSNHIRFFKNMMSDDFLRLLYNSSCLVGNSSAGIRECAYMGVPVVNIGSRQIGRERGKNVIDVAYDSSSIKNAILEHLENGHYESSDIYGDGNAGERIAAILSEVELTYHKILNL